MWTIQITILLDETLMDVQYEADVFPLLTDERFDEVYLWSDDHIWC